MPVGVVAATIPEAVEAARTVGLPCALKVSAPGLLHKTAVAAVVTDVRTLDEVLMTSARLLEVAEQLGGGVLLVERMVPAGVEILVAARADGVVPVLVLGIGGRWAEVLDDVVVVPLPAHQRRVREALSTLRGVPLLRASGATVLDHVAAVAAGVGALLLEQGWRMVELNPVIAGPAGAVAVDAVLVPAMLDGLPPQAIS
jgi:hypothetical protein